MDTYFNMESFGAMCPENWKEIAEYLNDKLESTAGDLLHDESCNVKMLLKEEAESIWDKYCSGGFLDAPKPI